MTRHDPHSYADDDQPQVTHLAWAVSVDMDSHVLDAVAVLTLDQTAEGQLDLDTRDLQIASVSDSASGSALDYVLGEPDAVLGQRLRISLPLGTSQVRIAYATTPRSTALQWLSPAQTAEGTHPFVYSQCQTIHARSMVPVPDSPACRMTMATTIDVPAEFTAVMAAQSESVTDAEPGRRRFAFRTDQPIPAYLLAFAVGRLESRPIGPRSVVWAEPSVLDAAAWEFAEVEDLVLAAEAVLGPLPWERVDLLVLPPSYPYGGMENPQLIFLTPTLITGDRSLVNVLSHEIVHQWTGNTVTCASLEHFWLNEGFTILGERKVTAAMDGPEMAELHAAIGRGHLDDDLRYLATTPELTCLRLHLEGLDPDVSSSWVAMEKGYLFLRAIEESVGAERFSRFLRAYLEHFRFRSLTGEEFIAFAAERLPGAVDYAEWLLEPGLPETAPRAASTLLSRIQAIGATLPDPEFAATWDATAWQVYLTALNGLDPPAPLELLAELDATYGLTTSTNHDTQGQWLLLALRAGYAPAVPATLDLLSRVGRLKHLKVLYDALADREDTRELAKEAFAANRASYHPIAVSVIEARLNAAH